VPECASQNACIGGQAYRWPNLPFTWFWNPNNRPSGFSGHSEADFETALKTAAAVWATPKCTSFAQSYGGKTDKEFNDRDRVNVLYFPTPQYWAQIGLGSSVLAFATPTPTGGGGVLEDADIVFNPNIRWGAVNVRPNEYDIVAIAAHELGHAVGIGHSEFGPSGNGDPGALMFYTAGGVGPQWATAFRGQLPKDDETAICTIYPSVTCKVDADCSRCFRCGANNVCVLRALTPTPSLCKPCTKPTDCGGQNDICIRTETGNRCAQACLNDACCPKGFRCASLGGGQRQCIPAAGTCPDVPCNNPTDCGPGETCSNNTCRPQTVNKTPSSCKPCQTNNTCSGQDVCSSVLGDALCFQPCAAELFCPTGYLCRSTAQGRLCIPERGFCACNNNQDCPDNQECRNQICTQPGGGQLGTRCIDERSCAPNHECTAAQGGKVCVRFCGRSTRFPKGAPGSQCTAQKTCTDGASCLPTQSNNICFPEPCPCQNGGQCYGIPNGGRRCLCQNDSECKPGFACNKQALGQFGGCAPKPNADCGNNASCNDADAPQNACSAQSQTCLCVPSGDREAGQTCSTQARCKEGLQCINLGAGNLRCFEVCNKDQANACTRTQLQCNIPTADDNLLLCGCSSSAPCPSGKTCVAAGNSASGYCTEGQSDSCGNNKCEPNLNENCASCPKDCACKDGTRCINKVCRAISNPCGNNRCESNLNENCASCPKDCACKDGTTCQQRQCKASATEINEGTGRADSVGSIESTTNPERKNADNKPNCPVEDRIQQCGDNGQNCVTVCAGGCQCQHHRPSAHLFLLLALLALFVLQRRRERSTASR
ncbi:MAG: matrixin family metalloprotease, partial [Myxococcota bacterium]